MRRNSKSGDESGYEMTMPMHTSSIGKAYSPLFLFNA